MTAPTYYRTQLVKQGQVVGLKIWRGHPVDPVTSEVLTERPAIWRAEINGEPVPIEDVAPWIADGTGFDVRGEICNEAEYRHYCNVATWATQHAPNDHAAKPRQAIDHLQGDLIF